VAEPAPDDQTQAATGTPRSRVRKSAATASDAARPHRSSVASGAKAAKTTKASNPTTGGATVAMAPGGSDGAAAEPVPVDGAAVDGMSADGTAGTTPAESAGWSAAELAEVRADLLAELATMGADYHRSLADLEVLQAGGSSGAGDDQADAGSATFEREQELSIVANRRDLIDQMQRAVARIDAGTYGFCERCGQPIPKARLQAFPAATLDVMCKQREERR